MFERKFILSAVLCLVCATGCYRMPTEEDFCLIPSTNNPDFTHESHSSMPGVGY